MTALLTARLAPAAQAKITGPMARRRTKRRSVGLSGEAFLHALDEPTIESVLAPVEAFAERMRGVLPRLLDDQTMAGAQDDLEPADRRMLVGLRRVIAGGVGLTLAQRRELAARIFKPFVERYRKNEENVPRGLSSVDVEKWRRDLARETIHDACEALALTLEEADRGFARMRVIADHAELLQEAAARVDRNGGKLLAVLTLRAGALGFPKDAAPKPERVQMVRKAIAKATRQHGEKK